MGRKYTGGSLSKYRNRWRATISWRDEDGNRQRKTRLLDVKSYPDKTDPETGKTVPDNRGRAIAETLLRKWRDELVAEEAKSREETPGCSQTVSEYIRNYIDAKRGSATVREVTLRGYRTHLRQINSSELGEMRTSDVTPQDVAGWERGLVEGGLSPATVSHAHVFVKQVFEWARRVGDIPTNPFDLVDAPKRGRKPINALSPSEVTRMTEALASYGPTPLAIGAKVAVMTGMRQGEICALRWQDVDLEGCTIRVEHALTRTAGHFELASPKTGTSIRTIPFGPRLKSVLLSRKSMMLERCAEVGCGWDQGLYVIGSPVEPIWKSPQALGQEWHQFARVAGLVGTQGRPPTFHDLRHTFATIAVSSGIDIKTVSVLLGHADPAMTLRVYADSLEDSKRSGMDRLDGIL